MYLFIYFSCAPPLVFAAVGDVNITAVLPALRKTLRNYTCLSFSMNEKHENETKLTLCD